MARDSKYDVLFEPIKIGPKLLRNRFYQVPHCTGFGVDKPWTQAQHRATKAEGGWAAVCTELAPISSEGQFGTGRDSCLVWDEGDVGALTLFCDAVHAHGALAGIELGHGGVHASRNETRLPAVAPSQLAGDHRTSVHVVPKAMDKHDIRRVQRDWTCAAQRAVRAGFDIVYVYGGHSMLPMQFLSPFYNKRNDEYGGSFENRARFWLETIEQVRDAVGDHTAIAVRISVDDFSMATVNSDEALGFIRLADHLVDLWDVNVASIADWGKDAGSSRFFAEGHQLDHVAKVRDATDKPIVGVGRWTDPDRMVEVVQTGRLDIIGAARPSIADPFLPRKIEEGRFDEIRECIGNNQCIARVLTFRHLGCTQNATAGEEYRRGWHPERFPRATNSDNDVLVVGAGPAGMEAAMVLGKRGMRRVHLVDAENDLGGHIRWLSQLPGLGQWARIINYRRIQLDKLQNVEFLPRTRLTAGDVRDYGAEIVILATGAHWSVSGLNAVTREPIPGADSESPHVLTPEQLMLNKIRPRGRRVMVYDCEGYIVGGALAERLALEGYDVELVTPFPVVGPLNDEALEGDLMRRHLHKLGVEMKTGVAVTEICDDGIRGHDALDNPLELATDAVVLVTQRISDDELYHTLQSDRDALDTNGITIVLRVGDCTAPRSIADAIFDGHRVGREIDGVHPAVPEPYFREGAFDRPIAEKVAKDD
jgi:dimethylamine/trimethylamine dehydrogenase